MIKDYDGGLSIDLALFISGRLLHLGLLETAHWHFGREQLPTLDTMYDVRLFLHYF